LNYSPGPDEAVAAVDLYGVNDLPHLRGWLGEQIAITFNPHGNYCLHAAEFTSATNLRYSIVPASLVVMGGFSVSTPARYVFQEPGSRNTVTFGQGCARSARIVVYFTKPEPY
jgi:hypothetical protein